MEEALKQLEKESKILEGTPESRNSVGEAIHRYTEQFIQNMRKRKAFNLPEEADKQLNAIEFTEEGRSLSEILALFDRYVERPGLNPASGGHLAYVPGGGIPSAAWGDYMAAITNKYAGIFFGSPGAVRVENQVIKWLGDQVGYGGNFGGNLASGGSIANLIAIVAARDAFQLKGKEYEKTVIYGSSHMHHCLDKAIRIAGLGECIYRQIPLTNTFKLDVDILQKTIEEDQANNLSPFLVICSAGTTNCGVIDPMEQIADLCEEHNLWFHVDGAYGGLFAMLEEEKPKFNGMSRADSIVVDPHKTLFLPYGLGVVLVKNIEHLKKSQYYVADYMQDAKEYDDELSPAEVSPELTKHFRGMRLWLPLLLHGIAPFKACMREKLLLTRYFREGLKDIPNINVCNEPELSIFAFRYEDPRASKALNNRINELLVQEIHKDGRVFLSSTTINGEFALRIAILSFRTHKQEIDTALRVLHEKLIEIQRHHLANNSRNFIA